MKKIFAMVLCWFFCCLLITWPAVAEEMSNEELSARVKKLEAAVGGDGNAQGWTDRITISGVLEAEAGFTGTDYNDPAAEDIDESDIVLATVELGIDAQIAKHVSGHLLLLWEEDDTDPIDVDEGFITIEGKDAVPLYMNAGKLYLPFGQFESHMVTDPMTLDLGETSQSAVQVGFANDWIDASIAVYNGDVDERDEDNTIGSYAAGVQIILPEGTVENLGLAAGISYISNLADTDGMQDMVATGDGAIEENVAGMGAFISVSFMEMIFLEAEYIGALDNYNAGELSFDNGEEVEPSAWNIELAYAPMDNLELAVRYAQTDDVNGGIDDEVLPETQYGIAVAYGLFDNTSLAFEYLNNEYENDDEMAVATAQVAIEF